jgi:hypothetical protein
MIWLLIATQAWASLSYKTVTMTYQFGEKRVEHVIDAKGLLSTTASDREAKTERKLEQDDLDFLDEKMKLLAGSKDHVSACRLSYVTFKVQSASGPDKTFTVCRGTKSENASITDKLLTVIAATK